jgi:hypothetical protein
MGGIQVHLPKTINHQCTWLWLHYCVLTPLLDFTFQYSMVQVRRITVLSSKHCVSALTHLQKVKTFFGHWITLEAHVTAFIMDQPERCRCKCLLGGDSKQHAMFGLSCSFENLERHFPAFPTKCLRAATRYLKTYNFEASRAFSCRLCYDFSLSRLVNNSKYISHVEQNLFARSPHCCFVTIA